MAIILKSPAQIELPRAAGQLVRQTFNVLREHIRPGVTTAELDAIAEEFIRSHGAEPVYKGYVPAGRRNYIPPFPGTICASINDVICHGIPSKRDRLRQGDIVGIDIGLRLNGWIGDACETFAVGEVDDETQRLLDVTRRCLELGIEQARVGNPLRAIGAAINAMPKPTAFRWCASIPATGWAAICTKSQPFCITTTPTRRAKLWPAWSLPSSR